MSRGQRLALVGTELSVAIFIGLYGGHWLDQRLATRPWLTVVGLILGLTAGFKGLYQTVRREQQRLTDEAKREAAARREPQEPPTE